MYCKQEEEKASALKDERKQTKTITECVLFTDEELTEELETGVALGRSWTHVSVRFVQSQYGFFHVALGLHSVPLVVVEGRRRAHAQLHRPVAHIKGEGDHVRSCVKK